eukprot:scaffold36576_cov372-Skeletonema_dohrnii-CCMP3373.AAC.1
MIVAVVEEDQFALGKVWLLLVDCCILQLETDTPPIQRPPTSAASSNTHNSCCCCCWTLDDNAVVGGRWIGGVRCCCWWIVMLMSQTRAERSRGQLMDDTGVISIDGNDMTIGRYLCQPIIQWKCIVGSYP